MQIITFPKRLQLVVLLTLAQLISSFLLYKNDAYKVFSVGCVSKWNWIWFQIGPTLGSYFEELETESSWM